MPRSGSRHCRCRRSVRRGFARPRPRARSPRSPRSASSTFSSRTPDINRFCQTVRRISPSPRSCAILASPRICSQVILPSGSATPIQFKPSCFCLCTPICAMRSNGRPRRKRLCRHARERRRPSCSSTSTRNLSMAHAVEHIFQPRLVAVGAVAELDEHAHDGVGDCGRVCRLDDDAGIFGKILVAGDAANPKAKPDARLDAETVLHLDRREGDVVGVFQHRDLAGAVEGDVELARQAVQRAVVEDVIVPLARIWRGCRAVPADRCRRSACP